MFPTEDLELGCVEKKKQESIAVYPKVKVVVCYGNEKKKKNPSGFQPHTIDRVYFIDFTICICIAIFCSAFRQVESWDDFKTVFAIHMWLLLMYCLLVILFIEGYYILYTLLVLWMYLKIYCDLDI